MDKRTRSKSRENIMEGRGEEADQEDATTVMLQPEPPKEEVPLNLSSLTAILSNLTQKLESMETSNKTNNENFKQIMVENNEKQESNLKQFIVDNNKNMETNLNQTLETNNENFKQIMIENNQKQEENNEKQEANLKQFITENNIRLETNISLIEANINSKLEQLKQDKEEIKKDIKGLKDSQTKIEEIIHQTLEESEIKCLLKMDETLNVHNQHWAKQLENTSREIYEITNNKIITANTETKTELTKSCNEAHMKINNKLTDFNLSNEISSLNLKQHLTESFNTQMGEHRTYYEQEINQVKDNLDTIRTNQDINKNSYESELRIIETKIKRYTASVNCMNTGGPTIKIENLTHFDGDITHVHPMLYLNGLLRYLIDIPDNKQKMDIIRVTLKDSAQEWFLRIEDHCEDVEKFVSLFKRNYWDEAQQNRAKIRLLTGKYRIGSITREIYASRIYNLCKHIADMEESTIARQLLNHFIYSDTQAIICQRVNDMDSLIEILRRLDDFAEGNRGSFLPAQRNANNSPYNTSNNRPSYNNYNNTHNQSSRQYHSQNNRPNHLQETILYNNNRSNNNYPQANQATNHNNTNYNNNQASPPPNYNNHQNYSNHSTNPFNNYNNRPNVSINPHPSNNYNNNARSYDANRPNNYNKYNNQPVRRGINNYRYRNRGRVNNYCRRPLSPSPSREESEVVQKETSISEIDLYANPTPSTSTQNH